MLLQLADNGLFFFFHHFGGISTETSRWQGLGLSVLLSSVEFKEVPSDQCKVCAKKAGHLRSCRSFSFAPQ